MNTIKTILSFTFNLVFQILSIFVSVIFSGSNSVSQESTTDDIENTYDRVGNIPLNGDQESNFRVKI